MAQPIDCVDTAMVIHVLALLCAGTEQETPRPATGAALATYPPSSVSDDDLDHLRKMAIIALINGVSGVLYIHVPRSAGFPDAPQRCGHDNGTWPCRTVSALLKDLAELWPALLPYCSKANGDAA